MALPSVAPVLPILLGWIAACAWILSMVGGIYCKFLSFTSNDGDNGPLSFGIWYYQGWQLYQNGYIYERCHTYPDGVTIDSKWKSARAFSTMTIIIGGLVSFWACFASCLELSKQIWTLGGMVLLLCCLFQGLSLLLLDSSACHNNSLITALQEEMPNSNLTFQSCSMAAGAKCTIAATVLWFVVGIAALKVDPTQSGKCGDQVETEDVADTKTTGEDVAAVVSENFVKDEPVVVGEHDALVVAGGQEVEAVEQAA